MTKRRCDRPTGYAVDGATRRSREQEPERRPVESRDPRLSDKANELLILLIADLI